MLQMNQHYEPEFKKKIVRLHLEEGRSLKSLAAEYGVSHASISNWTPKLRGHFAEFLNNASSVGLRILSSSTCVGLRYGHALHNSSFSRHMAHTLCYFISLHITSSDYTTDLPVVHLPRLYRSFHSRLVLSTCVPTVLIIRGTGI